MGTLSIEHEPRWKYDCDRCKFAWCCGPSCYCGLWHLANPPEDRQAEVDLAYEGWLARRAVLRGLP